MGKPQSKSQVEKMEGGTYTNESGGLHIFELHGDTAISMMIIVGVVILFIGVGIFIYKRCQKNIQKRSKFLVF